MRTARDQIMATATVHDWAVTSRTWSSARLTKRNDLSRSMYVLFSETGRVVRLEITSPQAGVRVVIRTRKRETALAELSRTDNPPPVRPDTWAKTTADQIWVGDLIRLTTADGKTHEFTVGRLPQRDVFIEPVNAPGLIFELTPNDEVERLEATPTEREMS